MTSRVSGSLALLFVLSLACADAQVAQTPPPPTSPAKPFEPTVGQAGKDVVWVPTPDAVVAKMLDLTKVTKDDVVIDLGSGDGRTVIAAAKRGAHATGIEYNPEMVELSKRNAEKAGVSDRATFVKQDLYETDLSKATVITMFLLPDINMKLRPKLLELKPGTRIASNSFTMEDWTPDESVTVSECESSWCTAHFWVVPAKVEGRWQLMDGDLELQQKFQMVSGTFRGKPIAEGRLRGDELTFTAGGTRYTGRVNGREIRGQVTGGGGGSWTATRR